MSEKYSKISESFMQREDWLVLLTGGLITGGAVGWIAYRGFKSQQLDFNAIKTIATSFAGGMGIYFTGSALVYMCRKSYDRQEKSITSQKDAPDITKTNVEIFLYEKFENLVKELERKFSLEVSKAKEWKCLDKETFINQETDDVHCKSEDVIKTLNDFNQKKPKKGLKLPCNNQMVICSNEEIGSRKEKFREIISYINELKGYVQGVIDPLPSARKIKFESTDMSDEMRRQVVMIVKEYANSMLPNLELVIDELMNSVYKTEKVPDSNKEYKVKKAFETLGVSEKDLSTELLKMEMNQYYSALENATKSKSCMPSFKNDHERKNVLGVNIQRLESESSPSLRGINTWAQTLECSLPVMPKLATPTSAGIPFISKEPNKLGHRAVENPHSNLPAKLSLNQEQKHYLNILKSEL